MTTRKWNLVILAVAACFTCLGCRPASQAYEGDPPPTPPLITLDEDSLRMRLLATKLIQKDLCLTSDQTEKLRSLYETNATRAREIYEKLRNAELHASQALPPEESEAGIQKFHSLMEDLGNESKKFRTKGLAILTSDQIERLQQIRIQTSIPEALKRPEIIKALCLSEEQLEKIHALCDQMEQKWEANLLDLRKQSPPLKPRRLPRNLSDLMPPDQEVSMIEFQKTSYQDREETTNRIWDLFTPEQQTELEKLTGKKIDLTQLHDEWIKSAESYLDSVNPETAPNPF